MRYHCLAVDFDGTLAHEGQVLDEVLQALYRLKSTGRRVILVTGRQIPDLKSVFARLDVFDRIVAENGALLFDPATGEERLLCQPVNEQFVNALKERGVEPVTTGRGIVAAWQPAEIVITNTIRDLGLELEVFFNKGAVMVLPSGVNKATGLSYALHDLGLSSHNVVAVGDGENDHTLLMAAECAIAVANAVPGLKQRADHVLQEDHGNGVKELIEMICLSDLKALGPGLVRDRIHIGTTSSAHSAQPITLLPYQDTVMICGPSGSGKSTCISSLLERFNEKQYQFCVLDLESEYQNLRSAVVLGDGSRGPTISEARHALWQPEQSVVLNLLGIPHNDRPHYLHMLLPHLQELKANCGRPQWLIIDEAHYVLPEWSQEVALDPQLLHGLILVTVHPEKIATNILARINTLIVTGDGPKATLDSYCHALNETEPVCQTHRQSFGQATFWRRTDGFTTQSCLLDIPKAEHQRHLRKYSEGDLGSFHSFYFTGPFKRLNLKAHNLQVFLLLSDGIDDESWFYHLRKHDYSRWLKGSIKDSELASVVEAIENDPHVSAYRGRAAIKSAILSRYCRSGLIGLVGSLRTAHNNHPRDIASTYYGRYSNLCANRQ